MPIKTIEKAEIRYLQVVDELGEADESLAPDIKEADLKKAFESIILARAFNQRALSLQREGRIGTYASIYGQEGSQVGSALALDKSDWIFPSFRESGVLIAMGYPPWMLYRYWAGDERGMKTPDELNIFPMSVPVGTHVPHAAGAAMAMRLKGAKTVAVAYFGDGGSSKADFYEGMNFAGVFKAPAVFICQNNQWAISVPRSRQTAATTIAQKAVAAGIEGVQVDGNDVLAVYRATKEAAERARSGGGPTLIECFTYRLDDHTTSDDAARYRSKEEVEEWKKREPLIRLRLYMEKKGIWTETYEKDATAKALKFIDSEIARAEAFPPPEPSDIMRYTNMELSRRQEKEMKEFGWQR